MSSFKSTRFPTAPNISAGQLVYKMKNKSFGQNSIKNSSFCLGSPQFNVNRTRALQKSPQSYSSKFLQTIHQRPDTSRNLLKSKQFHLNPPLYQSPLKTMKNQRPRSKNVTLNYFQNLSHKYLAAKPPLKKVDSLNQLVNKTYCSGLDTNASKKKTQDLASLRKRIQDIIPFKPSITDRLKKKDSSYYTLMQTFGKVVIKNQKSIGQISQRSTVESKIEKKWLLTFEESLQQFPSEFVAEIDSPLALFKQSVPKNLNTAKPNASQPQIRCSDFVVLKQIGKGRVGEVFLVLHKKTRAIFALKRMKKQLLKTHDLVDQFTKEAKVQFFMNHPNIVKLYGIFGDQTYVYLIMEYLQEGSLELKLSKNDYQKKGAKRFTIQEISECTYEVLNGISALHLNSIMHRDIKPDNIVISHGMHKLCDFGWATPIEERNRRYTYCGTLDYAAPEIFRGDSYCLEVDLWEFGVIVFLLATGKLPFYKPSPKQSIQTVLNYQGSLPFPQQVTPLLKDFIEKLLQKNPEDRLPAQQLLGHCLFKNLPVYRH